MVRLFAVLYCLFRRQVKCHGIMIEMPLVRAVAEGLVAGKSAATKRNNLPFAQTIHRTSFVGYLKVALYF